MMPTRKKQRSEETALSKAIRAALTAKGCKVLRINSGRVEAKNGGWVHGAEKGTPDLLVITPAPSINLLARYTHLEVKARNGKTTCEQNNWQYWADFHGVRSCVVRSISEAIDAVFGERARKARA